MEITLTITTDNEALVKEFLQYLRDFDIAHPGDEMVVHAMIDRRAENPPLAEMERFFDGITPPFKHKTVWKRKG